MDTKDIEIDSLYTDCIDMKPITVDWSEVASDEDGEAVTIYQSMTGDTSGRAYVLSAGEGDGAAEDLGRYEDPDEDEAEEWQEFGRQLGVEDPTDFETVCDALKAEYISMAEGPMMNYCYPLHGVRGFDPSEAAGDLAGLPLCVVEFSDAMQDRGLPVYALALTGGGTDLTWEICEAFMRIGQLPPVHFCALPAMADRASYVKDKEYGDYAGDLRIIEACRKSLQVKKGWIDNDLRQLDSLTKESSAA